MTGADLPELVQLCYDEYGSLASASSTSWTDGWEDAALRPYVWATLVLKVGVLPWLPTTTTLPSDHVILVASLSIPSSDDNSLSTTQERLVGMAEVSRQPAQPDRNPPAWPIPLVLKEAYCRWGLVRTGNHRTTQGWLTNLLVVPAHRGRGWSKVLVQAAEGVARAWGRSSLHLHCHATTPVPQALYRSLGYRPPCEDDKKNNAYAWTINAAEPSVAWQSSIYLFEGVPLLYMCKSLELENEAD
jgi:GNAT superfamily N-acetyltransferase